MYIHYQITLFALSLSKYFENSFKKHAKGTMKMQGRQKTLPDQTNCTSLHVRTKSNCYIV
jgi:hypothetical protein